MQEADAGVMISGSQNGPGSLPPEGVAHSIPQLQLNDVHTSAQGSQMQLGMDLSAYSAPLSSTMANLHAVAGTDVDLIGGNTGLHPAGLSLPTHPAAQPLAGSVIPEASLPVGVESAVVPEVGDSLATKGQKRKLGEEEEMDQQASTTKHAKVGHIPPAGFTAPVPQNQAAAWTATAPLAGDWLGIG